MEGEGGEGGLSLRVAIREHVDFVLRLCGGNRSRAARLLGVDRRTLQRYLVREDQHGRARIR